MSQLSLVDLCPGQSLVVGDLTVTLLSVEKGEVQLMIEDQHGGIDFYEMSDPSMMESPIHLSCSPV